jgi:arsenate reductase (glutaredoxin)
VTLAAAAPASPLGSTMGCVAAQIIGTMSEVTIYHNPSCGTSRNTLAIIRHAGFEPTVIEYLKTPPTKALLRKLLADAGLSVREILREKEALYAELRLADLSWSDDQLLDIVGQHPILMNRPIVVTPLGTKLCRPQSEAVLEILPEPKLPAFTKEDGQQVIDTGKRRGK